MIFERARAMEQLGQRVVQSCPRYRLLTTRGGSETPGCQDL